MDRKMDELREVRIESAPGFSAGRVLISQGSTKVLCTAGVSTALPPWIRRDEMGVAKHGWVTAEYSMLPGSTPQRKGRGTDSRATEIQRLIARSLRAGVSLEAMAGVVITCDCDVLQADGGTRTAAITGAWVALAQAAEAAVQQGLITQNPIKSQLAAVSVGMVDGQVVLDLDYALDSRAEVDLNVVMTHSGGLIEVQGTAEGKVFSRQELDQMLDAAWSGIRTLMIRQTEALAAFGVVSPIQAATDRLAE